MPIPKENKVYTYKDYLTWTDEHRYEIIQGSPYLQAAPSWEHQAISGELLRQISNYLVNRSCRVFSSPFDLRLADEDEKDEDVSNVYQPDLLVVCDTSKLKGTGYKGVPDLIIEITSPSTARTDKLLKFNSYEKFGVKEYWIIEPETKLLSVFTLQEDNRYGRPELYTEFDKIKVSIFENLIVDLSTVFNF